MSPVRSSATLVGIGAVAGVALVSLILLVNNRTQPAPILITPPPPTPTAGPTETPVMIRVYVSGEVRHPAVYELAPGSIAQDAVTAAGGFTADANQVAINLALPLADGMQLHVPGPDAPTPGPGLIDGAASVPGAPQGPININMATLEQLDTLPGIGPSTAGNIIDYRQSNGPFQSVDDVINVPGIGPVKLEQIRPLITVD
jgi:competence protein ComEA